MFLHPLQHIRKTPHPLSARASPKRLRKQAAFYKPNAAVLTAVDPTVSKDLRLGETGQEAHDSQADETVEVQAVDVDVLQMQSLRARVG
jgi:hypothetical protein